MSVKVLIVEDLFIEAHDLRNILQKAGHWVCGIAKSVEQALEIFKREQPEIVLLDIFLQGELTGIDLAKLLSADNVPFIYLSANSNEATFEAAKATHPYGFLIKPFHEKDILAALDIASYRHRHIQELLRKLNETKNAGPKGENGPFLQEIIGKSATLQQVLEQVNQVAPFDTTVLILGETGVGKEGIGRAIHQLSGRSGQPFVKINCAAIPSTLVEAELFGYEKGSFTGAFESRIGKFEQAQGGTIFLDEIGEIPIEIQSKLLRVLQEKELERIGGRTTIRIDVRIIAATNRNLYKEVAAGRFRIDLYYRINVFPVRLPPLRERREDIPLLTDHFLLKNAHLSSGKAKQFTPEALQVLINYSWPGNIRELEHLVERHVLITPSMSIAHIDIPDDVMHESVKKTSIKEGFKTIADIDKEHIIEVLKKCNGKVSGKGGAAEMLQIPSTTLNSKMKKLGISWKFLLDE